MLPSADRGAARDVQGRTDRTSGAVPARRGGPDAQPRKLPRAGAQRRLHPAVVLSAQPVAVADRDQGGVPRTGGHRRQLRPAGPFAQPRHADPQRDRAAAIRAAERVSRLHPLQPVPARPLRLPVLRQREAPDLRPRRPPPAGRADDVGEHHHRLRAVQHEEGRPHPRAGEDAARTSARSARPAGSCTSTARRSRPTTCTKPGATGCTGTSNWRLSG